MASCIGTAADTIVVGGTAAAGGAAAGAAAASAPKLNIVPEVAAIEAEIIENRRWFHAHPELSFKEVVTAAKVAELLRSYGITEVVEGVGRTGVVALIRGGAGEGPCIGLRADMDALPLPETADVPYKSTNDGVMHACGHDGEPSRLRRLRLLRQRPLNQQCRTLLRVFALQVTCLRCSRQLRCARDVVASVRRCCAPVDVFGHTCLTACLVAWSLWCAQVLHAERAKLRGTVKLIFQPAEEGHGEYSFAWLTARCWWREGQRSWSRTEDHCCMHVPVANVVFGGAR